jgi:hypothetical protein
MKKLLISIIALFCILPQINTLSAQDSGEFKFGFRTGYYFLTKAYGLGVYGTYGITDWLNIEPGINYIFKNRSTVDVYCDFQVPLEISHELYLFPIVGVSINDITSHSGNVDGWAGGFNIGLGTRWDMNRRWGVHAQLKWMERFPKKHMNALILSVGIDYNY